MEYDFVGENEKEQKNRKIPSSPNNNNNNSHFMINDIYFDFLSVNKKKEKLLTELKCMS